MKHYIDLKNLLCPMPVIRVQNKLNELNTGDILDAECTDPGTLHDIPTWCRINGHEVLEIKEEETIFFSIKKN